MKFKNKTRDEMISWCKENPGVVVSYSIGGAGMVYDGQEMKYYFARGSTEPLGRYGEHGPSTWFIPEWSPVKPEQKAAKHEFSVGDEVWSEKFGKGYVKNDNGSTKYPMCVEFNSNSTKYYTRDSTKYYTREGKYFVDNSYYNDPRYCEKDIVPYTGQDQEIFNLIKEGIEDAIEHHKAHTTPDPPPPSTPKVGAIVDYLSQSSEFPREIPDNVKRYLLGDMGAKLHYADDTVSLGQADYGSLEQMREAIEWLVEQFGGEVRWD